MRKLVLAVLAALAVAAVVALPANATSSSPTKAATSSRLSMSARITSFHATAAGVLADGVLTSTLRSGTRVTHKSAPVKFAVAASKRGGRCNVLNLRLAPVNLELLGVQVTTSYISLDVYAVHGAVLGNLFCALAHAKVTFPRAAGARAASAAHALNKRLHSRPLRLFSTTGSLASAAQAQPQTCQVLKLVLGPLHLNLLGLDVDLYGKTKSDPVVVTINAIPSQGLLGQLLCGVAGGGGITSVAGLQSLLNGLGLNLSTLQVQNLLNQLGIGNISSGLTETQLNQILQALGLGQTVPTG